MLHGLGSDKIIANPTSSASVALVAEVNRAMTPTLHWTSYGAPAYAVLRTVVAEVKRDDPLRTVTVVVPSNRCGISVRRTLAAGVGELPGIVALQVLTIDRLAELLAAPTLAAQGRRPATGPVLSAAWRRSLAQEPGLFGDVAKHPSTVTALVEAHRNLRLLLDDALDAVADCGELPREVVRLHRDVRQRLETEWYDTIDLRRSAAAQIDQRRADEIGTVVVFIPQDLDRTSVELLDRIAQHQPVHVVAALTGLVRADARTYSSVERLVGPALPPTDTPIAVADDVLHASDADDEVRCVVRQVVSVLAAGTPAHRVAVLYPDDKPYARLLSEHLRAAGITTNGPGTRSTLERTVARVLLQLLGLAERGVGRGDLFALLSAAVMRTSDGTVIPTARWERLSREAGVVASHDWAPRLQRYEQEQRARMEAESHEEDPRPHVVERHERSAADAQALLAFVQSLQNRLAAGSHASSWQELAAWARSLLTGLLGAEILERGSRLPPAERRAAERVAQVLSSLVGVDSIDTVAGLDALRDVVELELSDDLVSEGVFGTGVLVAPLSASLGLVLDHVFVVGLAEDLCPGRVREDALLPDAAREVTNGELALVRDRLDRQHRYLLVAFASAEHVTASFPRGDLHRSSPRIPSRWLLPTLRHLSGDPTLAASAWEQMVGDWLHTSASFASAILTEDAVTSQEWQVQGLAARHAGRDVSVPADIARARGGELLDARHSSSFTRFDGNLSAHRDSLPDYADDVRSVAPTTLESWVSCPHAFFLQRLLFVEPIEQPEELLTISPADRGSLIHDTLDRFFAEVTSTGSVPDAGTAWSSQQRERLLAIGADIADEYQQRGVSGHPTMWQRERMLILDDLARFLSLDDEARAKEARTQVRSELTFGRLGMPPVEVHLADGRTLLMRGSADRVDVRSDGSLVVIDYKTGSTRRFKDISQDAPDAAGSKLQLPAYAYAARLALGLPEAAAKTEYWFIGPKDRGKRIGVDLTPQVETRYAEVLTAVVDGIKHGLFPANAPEDKPFLSWIECAYCDPDGLGAKDRRVQWEQKKDDPALAPYVTLVDAKEKKK